MDHLGLYTYQLAWPLPSSKQILKNQNLLYIYKGLWVVYKLLQTLVQICLDIKEKQNLYNIITTWMPLWLIFISF